MYPSITHQTPGIHSRFETQEPQIFWGNSEFWGKDVMFGLLDGSSRDLGQAAGSQHILRAGLVLGYHVANERWVPYDSTAAAAEGGTLRGVLAQTVAVVIDGVDTDKTIAISTARTSRRMHCCSNRARLPISPVMLWRPLSARH